MGWKEGGAGLKWGKGRGGGNQTEMGKRKEGGGNQPARGKRKGVGGRNEHSCEFRLSLKGSAWSDNLLSLRLDSKNPIRNEQRLESSG